MIWPLRNQKKDGTFTITAKLRFQRLQVKIPFWSHANGMKDVSIFRRQADGSYTVTAKPVTTKMLMVSTSAGLLIVDAQGHRFCQAFIDIKIISSTGTLLIQNNNKNAGTDVVIKDL